MKDIPCFFFFLFLSELSYSLKDFTKSCCSEIEAVEELVEKNGLSILNARDEWGYTPAHWAALDGNIEVREIINCP